MHHAGNLNLLGEILKTHGIEGHLVLKFSFITEDELTEGEPVFIEIDGIPVPFFISYFRFLSGDSAIVGLDEVDSAGYASEFVNCRVLIQETAHDGRFRDIDEGSENLSGFLVIDENFGEAGILAEIIEYPENPVMRIEKDGKEILIPFHENIVKNINYGKRVIEISAPEGLFDLYL